MDGTLLNNHLRIPAENVRAIKELQQEGVVFMVATGRDYEQAAPLLHSEGIQCPVIALNGAKFYDESGKQLFAHDIPMPTVHSVLDILASHGIHVEMTSSEGIVSNNKQKRLEAFAAFIQETNPSVPFKEAVEIAAKEADQLGIRFVPSYDDLLNKNSTKVYKLSAYTEKDPATLFPVKEELLQLHNNLAVSSFHESNLEINHIKAQKGLTLSHFAEQHGISSDEVMAIGDNQNDLSMLQWAKYSIGMLNGSPEVRSAVRHITATNDEHGVAQAIQKFVQQSRNTL